MIFIEFSKPLKDFRNNFKTFKKFKQPFEMKFAQRIFQTQPWKQSFSKFLKDATFRNKGF